MESNMQINPKQSEMLSQKLGQFMAAMFCLAISFVLFVGWRLRTTELITAEYGTGHILGIVGTLFMLLLMIYPARKRFSTLAVIGSVKMWFRIHMILGIIGPVCILFHATFRLGSLNSNVALFTMLTIAASGIFGRYAYIKIHDGLYGQRITLVQLIDRFNCARKEVTNQFAPVPEIREELLSVAAEVLKPCTSLSESVRRLCYVKYRRPLVLWKITHVANTHLKNSTVNSGWTHTVKRNMRARIKLQANLFLDQVVGFAQFVFFERVFAIWQVLHIPSSYILALVVLVHIIAVSLY